MDVGRAAQLRQQSLLAFTMALSTQKHSVGFRQLRGVDYGKLDRLARQTVSGQDALALSQQKVQLMRNGSKQPTVRTAGDLRSLQEHEVMTVADEKNDVVRLPRQDSKGHDIITGVERCVKVPDLELLPASKFREGHVGLLSND